MMADSSLDRSTEALGRARLALFGFDDAFARRVQRRIDEGLDAVHVKCWQHEGTIIEDVARVDFTERRLAAELGAKLLDWMPNKLEHEVHGEVAFTVVGLDGEQV